MGEQIVKAVRLLLLFIRASLDLLKFLVNEESFLPNHILLMSANRM